MLAPRANSSLSKQLPTLQLCNERVDDLNDNNKQVVYSKNLHKQVIDEEEEDSYTPNENETAPSTAAGHLLDQSESQEFIQEPIFIS